MTIEESLNPVLEKLFRSTRTLDGRELELAVEELWRWSEEVLEASTPPSAQDLLLVRERLQHYRDEAACLVSVLDEALSAAATKERTTYGQSGSLVTQPARLLGHTYG
ncbi:MAG: hypothetical protein HY791_25265 [Deltaproteobacteria bacterium]|nr:hypothetical protein [Deltaproteobacteria bacterium]